MTWFKTIKGRGYVVTGYKSHGTPHRSTPSCTGSCATSSPRNTARTGPAWTNRHRAIPRELRAQFEANLKAIADTITSDDALVEYLADRLVELGESVPQRSARASAWTPSENPWHDKRLWDFRNYPTELFVKPGSNVPNRAALGKWGAWVNSFGRQHYDRPLFLAMSADLAESTNIAGFANGFGDVAGWGRYDREHNPEGALLSAGDHRIHQLRCGGRASPASTSHRSRWRSSTGFTPPTPRTRRSAI